MVLKKKYSLAALIINWNGSHDTIELIESLANSVDSNIILTVAIIDNASIEEDKNILRDFIQTWQKYKIIYQENAVNVGIPGAYNQAIQIAGTGFDYYLRLDNDVILTSNAIANMIKTCEDRKTENAGIIGGNIKYYHSRNENNGGAVTFNLLKGKSYIDYPSTIVECDGVLGCIMLISGELVRSLMPFVFNASLFIFTDESELSLKAKTKNFKTFYIPELIGYHKGGSSTSKVKDSSYYFTNKNWFFLRLVYSSTVYQKIQVLFFSLIYIPISIIRGRWLYLIALIAGLANYMSYALDNYVRGK